MNSHIFLRVPEYSYATKTQRPILIIKARVKVFSFRIISSYLPSHAQEQGCQSVVLQEAVAGVVTFLIRRAIASIMAA